MCFCIKIVDFIIFKLLLPDQIWNLPATVLLVAGYRARNWERAAVKKTSVWREIQMYKNDSHNKYCYVFETKIGRPDFRVSFKNLKIMKGVFFILS